MEGSSAYTKKLCMTELSAEHAHYTNAHFFDAGAGKVNSSFCYVVQGEGDVTAIRTRFSLHAGELFFVPEGIRYSAVWRGSPDIEFYFLHIISRKYDLGGSTGELAIARIPELSRPETGQVFAEIYQLLRDGARVKKIQAIGRYYDFYAQVFPYLRTDEPHEFNPALVMAIGFMEQHYAEEFPIGQLAASCCVSESRLFHLFNAELHTTPIRYRNEIRVEKASELLRRTSDDIETISGTVGFHSPAHFREIFRGLTDMSPTEYRKVATCARGTE